MKKNWPYFLLLALVLFVLFRASRQQKNRRIDWRENYTYSSKAPFGCEVSALFLDDLMDDSVQEWDRTAYQVLAGKNFREHNYVFVNAQFDPSAQDVFQLCRFVHEGNTVLISARSFGLLSDTLHVETGDPLFADISKDTATIATMVNAGNSFIEANMVSPSLHAPKNYIFGRTTYGVAFTRFDTLHTLVLGTDGRKFPNYIRVPMGKGYFYLHTLPDAFANYYAADPPTSKYLFSLLSYIPHQNTFLDTHYKIGRTENRDTRRYLMSEPALRLAYYILITIGVIALFFGGKRRQRPVPVLSLPANSTLEFVEQVGALYYRQGNHADIAHKKINYFLESVRSRFYVQTWKFDDDFIARISSRSGIPADKVSHLFKTIDHYRQIVSCGEKDLRTLEKLIREFNSQSKR